jgi:hypothetical protein
MHNDNYNILFFLLQFSVWSETVLQAVEFPASITNLDAGLQIEYW